MKYALMVKQYPASPLVPVRDEPLFVDRNLADAKCAKYNASRSMHVAGGGPYYFVVPVQS